MSTASLAPDLLAALAPRFTVARELGRGGMGTVVLAHDQGLERDVAIKILNRDFSTALGPERFTREIRLTARLVHPNIVPLFDSGVAADCLYYVMPFIDGITLRQRLEQEGRQAPADVTRILADLGEALAYAHALGTVHRDIKPENVFWYRGRALLSDFGIATSLGDVSATQRLTEAGMVVGTLPYISPEQINANASVDGRADLYSLGCMGFELLTGQPPFVTNNPVALLAAHLTMAIPSVSQIRRDVPRRLDTLISRLMAKAPEGRPATAAAMLEQLRVATPEAPNTQSVPAVNSVTPPTIDLPPDALEALHKARALYASSVHGGPGARGKLELAKAYFEKALARVPGNPHALLGLADTVHVLGIRGFTDLETSATRAKEMRYQALAADDSIGELHTSLGVTFLYWDDEFEQAGVELSRGAELSPQDSMARRIFGAWLKIAGRLTEALAEMQAAVALAPDAPFMRVGLADILMTLGRYNEAVEPLRYALRLDPRYDSALERLEISCHRAGRHDDALDARRALLGVRGAVERMEHLSAQAIREGWPAARETDLRAELAELISRAEHEDPFSDLRGSRQISDQIVIVLAELGEWSQAMDWVERAYHRRPGRLRRILTDLPYDHHGLAVDPRYARLLRTAGLQDLLSH